MDAVKRTFDEENILKKFAYEKTLFLQNAFPKKSELRGADYCAWRESYQRYMNYYTMQFTVRRTNMTADLKTLISGLTDDFNYSNQSMLQRLVQTLRDRYTQLTVDWKKRRAELQSFFDGYLKIEKIPPLDEFRWMKNDVLFGNQDMYIEDFNTKVQNIVVCLKTLNGIYQTQRAMVSELVVDETKKFNASQANTAAGVGYQIWGQDEFQAALGSYDEYLEDLRIDSLTILETQKQSQNAAEFKKAKEEARRLVEKLTDSGLHQKMDEQRIRVMKNLFYSLQVWSEILHTRLNKVIVIFEDVADMIFLSDRVFPFLLDLIKQLAEENKSGQRPVEELLTEWRSCSSVSSGLELSLNHLEAKLKNRWVEGCREIKKLLEDVTRLKRLIGYLWGEATAVRIYKRISSQTTTLKEDIERISKYKVGRFDRKELVELAPKIFSMVVDLFVYLRKTSESMRTISSNTRRSRRRSSSQRSRNSETRMSSYA